MTLVGDMAARDELDRALAMPRDRLQALLPPVPTHPWHWGVAMIAPAIAACGILLIDIGLAAVELPLRAIPIRLLPVSIVHALRLMPTLPIPHPEDLATSPVLSFKSMVHRFVPSATMLPELAAWALLLPALAVAPHMLHPFAHNAQLPLSLAFLQPIQVPNAQPPLPLVLGMPLALPLTRTRSELRAIKPKLSP